MAHTAPRKNFFSKLGWSVRKRALPKQPIVVPYDDDLKIQIRPIDRFGKTIYFGGNSEPELAALLDAYLKPGMTFFDVGSHIGQFTLFAAKRVGPSGQVHAFEASSWTYSQVSRNVSLNNLSHVTTNHLAVCDSVGSIEITVCVPGKEAFNSIGKPLRPEDQIAGTETVATTTLDTYCAEHSITKIDMMKVDIEGAEELAFKGATNLLAADDAPPMFVEFNEHTARAMDSSTLAVRELLESHGYGIYQFDVAQPQRC